MTRVTSKKKITYLLDQHVCHDSQEVKEAKESVTVMASKPGAHGMYDIKHGGEGFVVDILDETCTCRVWLFSGNPRCHVLAVRKEEKLYPIQFVHDRYNIEKLRNTYTHTFVTHK